MIVFSNAKINIGLNIIEKRNDGFHNIESIFYPVLDLYDVLEVVENQENQLEFTSSGIEIPGNMNSNLCVKAFELIQQDFSIPFVKIHLHKVRTQLKMILKKCSVKNVKVCYASATRLYQKTHLLVIEQDLRAGWIH